MSYYDIDRNSRNITKILFFPSREPGKTEFFRPSSQVTYVTFDTVKGGSHQSNDI